MITIKKCWENDTVAILASGPSLKQTEIDFLKGKVKVISVNDSWRLCPWGDMLYAADGPWWRHYNFVTEFKGKRWTQNKGGSIWPIDAEKNGLIIIKSEHKTGISFNPSLIHTGYNSGFQALNIAVLKGATKILLLGFDCGIFNGKSHWFGDHPKGFKKANKSAYSLFIKEFNYAAPQLIQAGIKVINCSLKSNLSCFEKIPLINAL